MSCLSFFHLFSDFLLKNRAKFDTFSLIFEFQPPLLIRFSDTEILIVCKLLQPADRPMAGSSSLDGHFGTGLRARLSSAWSNVECAAHKSIYEAIQLGF